MMRRLVTVATRVMPVALLAMALVVVAQFWFEHGPSVARVQHYLALAGGFARSHAWMVLAIDRKGVV